MKKTSKDKLIQLLSFKLNEKKNAIAGINNLIKQLNDNQSNLEKELENEIAKHHVDNYTQFTFPLYIVAMKERLKKIASSLEELIKKRNDLNSQLQNFYKDIKKTEAVISNIEENEKRKNHHKNEEDLQNHITTSFEQRII